MEQLNKPPFFLEQGKDCSEQFSGGSHNCLNIRFAFLSLFPVVSSEVRAASFDTTGHDKDNSSGVAVTSFGELASSAVITRLFDDRVQTAKTNQFSPPVKPSDINNFTEEIDSTLFTDTGNGTEYLYFLSEKPLCRLRKERIDFIPPGNKGFPEFNLHQQQLFIQREVVGDGRAGHLINLLCGKRKFSPLTIRRKKFLCFGDKLFLWCLPDGMSRRKLFQEIDKAGTEQLCLSFQFRENQTQYSADFSFCSGNLPGKSFLFSYQVSQLILFFFRKAVWLLSLILDKLAYYPGIFVVGLGRLIRDKLEKLFHLIGINHSSIVPATGEKIKAENILLFEPLCSGKMLFSSPGLIINFSVFISVLLNNNFN